MYRQHNVECKLTIDGVDYFHNEVLTETSDINEQVDVAHRMGGVIATSILFYTGLIKEMKNIE